MSILNWLKVKSEQRRAENELVNEIIRSMREESNGWTIDEYCARFGKLSIWISNSPYADMTINKRRLPRRGELRRALAFCLMKQKRDLLTTPK